MLLALILLFAATPARSQVARNLVTNQDGSVLYFDSNARPVGSPSSLHSKIFRWTAAEGLRIAREVAREPLPNDDDQLFYTCRETNFYALHTPQVSATGELAGYTAQADLFLGAPWCYVPDPQAVLNNRTLPGTLTLAPGGEWAITTDNATRDSNFHWATPLPDGEPVPVVGTFAGGSHRVTRDGRIVATSGASILLAGPDGQTRVFPIRYPVNDVAIDPEGRTIAFNTGLRPGISAYLGAIDVSTGRVAMLFEAFNFANPRVAGDGESIFVIGRMVTGLGSGLFRTNRSGTDATLIAEALTPRSLTISADSRFAFAETATQGLLRLNLTTGETSVLLPNIAAIEKPPTKLAAGDPLTIFNTTLTSVTACGQPATLINAGASTRIITPYGIEGACEVILRSANSPIESGFVAEFQTYLPAFIGRSSQVLFILTGLGPHDGTRLLRPGFHCRTAATDIPIDTVGPAPNQPGYYLLDLQLPPNPGPVLTCGWNLDSPHEDWIYADYRLTN